ncbi:hypothetical protein RKE29_28650 [Streptomyces sp. B1866]|uniref:hypothetical protein n=1 Tax=Streptomyces sp. B1866 TaxID=3075431 RepID=UPI00288FA71F|nr:hypothetical protein [Streptomyces sp. B1866]MDT3400533.1 hypothetical protein [Streptomyces sp. B1866]
MIASAVASSLLAGSLAFGTAAFGASGAGSPDRPPRTTLPGADTVLSQNKTLGDLSGVLRPVTDLVRAVGAAPNGALPATDLKQRATDIKGAIDTARNATKKPAVPAKSGKQPAKKKVSAKAKAKAKKTAKRSAHTRRGTHAGRVLITHRGAAAPGSARVTADLLGDALAALEKSIDGLSTAVQSGDQASIVKAMNQVLTDLVNVSTATLSEGGLPAASMPGLPKLPRSNGKSSRHAVPPAQRPGAPGRPPVAEVPPMPLPRPLPSGAEED